MAILDLFSILVSMLSTIALFYLIYREGEERERLHASRLESQYPDHLILIMTRLLRLTTVESSEIQKSLHRVREYVLHRIDIEFGEVDIGELILERSSGEAIMDVVDEYVTLLDNLKSEYSMRQSISSVD